MSVFRKIVKFYRVEVGPDPDKQFRGPFPAQSVLDRIAALDLSSGNYHIAHGLFSNETFCMVHDGPLRILGGYNKDTYAIVTTEYKGELQEVEMLDEEGIVDATYVGFFPDSVAAIVRTSLRSPGPNRIAHWLSIMGPVSCTFRPIPQPDTLANLDRNPDNIRAVNLAADSRTISAIQGSFNEGSRPYNVAQSLASAARLSGGFRNRVKLRMSPWNIASKRGWWREFRQTIVELGDLLPEFASARVEMVHGPAVDLRDSYIQAGISVEIDASKRVDILSAASAIVDSYDNIRMSIEPVQDGRARSI